MLLAERPERSKSDALCVFEQMPRRVTPLPHEEYESWAEEDAGTGGAAPAAVVCHHVHTRTVHARMHAGCIGAQL